MFRVAGLFPAVFSVLAALLLSVPQAYADQIVLKNGDRLTGKVISKTPAGLMFDTDYTEPIRIDWQMVESIRTDEMVKVLVRGRNGILETRLHFARPAVADLDDTPEVHELPLSKIVYLNPTPSQSGLGTEYYGRLNLSGSADYGNSDKTQLSAEGELRGLAKGSRFTTRLRTERRTQKNSTTVSNWQIDGDRDWFIDNRRFFYARTFARHDRIRDLSLRFTLGGGYGKQLINNDRTSLSLQGGLDYMRERRYDADSERYYAFGWGVRFRHWLPQRIAEFFHEEDGYISTRDVKDVTLRTRTGLRVPIAAQLSMQLQALLDWEGRPAEDQKPTDLTMQLGINYEW